MKIRIQIILILALFGLLAACHGQGTLPITFDGPPIQPPQTAYTVQSYQESGMAFSSLTEGFTRVGPSLVGRPQNGTSYLAAPLGESLVFNMQNNFPFGVVSVDLASYSTLVPDFTINFVGYLPNGSTIITNFSGTGIDFRTVNFGSEWSSGLTRVEIPNYAWSLDNLTVGIPEPTSSVLIWVGAVILGLSRMKGREA
jgi:hypothetical protein